MYYSNSSVTHFNGEKMRAPNSSLSVSVVSDRLPFILNILRNALFIASFAFLTALAAQIQIPLEPVPVTLQTLAVAISGLLLGSRRGTISQLTYISLGLLGAPFFSSIAGWGLLLRPSAGYVLGFLPMAFVAGLVGESLTKKFIKGTLSTKQLSLFAWVGALLASLPCFFVGVVWLKFWMNSSWQTAIHLGLTPFILGDLIKTTLATGVFVSLTQVSTRIIGRKKS